MDWNTFWTNVAMVCQDIAWRLLGAIFLLVVGKLVISFVIKRLKKGKLAQKADATVHGFVISFAKIAMYVVLAVSIIAVLGVPMASIITVLGSVGVAISLAVQGTLGNLASGIMLLVFKPFRDGDYIEVDSYGGTVTEIGVFYTTVITGDNRTVVIPNSTLTSSTLINYSKKDTRRLDIEIGVDYESDIELVKRTVLEVVGKHENIKKDPAPFIRLTNLGDSSLDMTLRVWCDANDYWSLKFDLLEEIVAVLAQKNINIPYPTLDVHLDK